MLFVDSLETGRDSLPQVSTACLTLSNTDGAYYR
jgi:hypothetical protein